MVSRRGEKEREREREGKEALKRFLTPTIRRRSLSLFPSLSLSLLLFVVFFWKAFMCQSECCNFSSVQISRAAARSKNSSNLCVHVVFNTFKVFLFKQKINRLQF